ncbi:MAG: PQQ-dependent sugar dehydrogenase [Candidatus Eremiobacteraeota bacterium]|nr:PQQ-dependent sugar dehydrogenase [Candidatus Eremiobacteraeota bacterium]MBC5826533.1 PQQ-dependent sugar dehydrogenase [Candidatus Eremiobacteraeota bacterium]
MSCNRIWLCAVYQAIVVVAVCGCGAAAAPVRSLTVPQGFQISLVSERVPGARFMAFAPNGDLLVSQPEKGQVVAIRRGANADDDPKIIVSGSELAHGLAFRGPDAYVASWAGVSKLHYPPSTRGGAQKLFSDLPEGGDHNLRAVALGADGTIYVSSGSTCNVCKEDDARFATVLRYGPSGGRGRIYASGLRNASGLAFDQRGRLWAVVNGRDMIGDDRPADELDLIKEGVDYGWPYCYGFGQKRLPNPEYGDASKCASAQPPTFAFQAHSAPLGFVFYNAKQFPAAYQGVAFVAFHGSWNKSTPTGYKVVAVRFDGGRPTRVEDFMTGWLTTSGKVLGRPVGLAVGPDGALYVSDDSGYVFRVSYQAKG